MFKAIQKILAILKDAVDHDSEAISVIESPHKHVHEGKSFYVVYSAEGDDAAVVEVRVQTPDSLVEPHMTINFKSALKSTIEMWIDTTKTDESANRITPMNRDHNSENPSKLIVCHTPGGAEAAAADLTEYIGSASTSGLVQTGGFGGSRGEFILKRNTAYLFRITSGADSNAMTFEFDWYEIDEG